MGRSPSFGSTPCDLCALFRLAFATAPRVSRLTSPQRVTRRLILQEARRQTWPEGHRPSTACKHTVSGSFHSPHRGAFHLSLTVLVHYRSSRVFSLGRWTPLLPTGLACPMVLKVTRSETSSFSPTGVSPALPGLSNTIRLRTGFVTPCSPGRDSSPGLTTPNLQRLPPYAQMGLGSSLFARHYSGNVLSSWRYLDVSVPSVPPAWPMCSASGDQLLTGQVSPFGYPRINAR